MNITFCSNFLCRPDNLAIDLDFQCYHAGTRKKSFWTESKCLILVKHETLTQAGKQTNDTWYNR